MTPDLRDISRWNKKPMRNLSIKPRDQIAFIKWAKLVSILWIKYSKASPDYNSFRTTPSG